MKNYAWFVKKFIRVSGVKVTHFYVFWIEKDPYEKQKAKRHGLFNKKLSEVKPEKTKKGVILTCLRIGHTRLTHRHLLR